MSLEHRLKKLEAWPGNGPVVVEHREGQTRDECLAAARKRYPGRIITTTLPPASQVDVDEFV